jgi:hypothetical protein
MNTANFSYKELIVRKQLKCSDCIHSKVNPTHKGPDRYICKLFTFKPGLSLEPNNTYNADTVYCRSNEYLCGPYAKYFEFDETIENDLNEWTLYM